MSRALCIDVETSAIPIFKPWQAGSYLTSVAARGTDGISKTWLFDHVDNPHPDKGKQYLAEIQGGVDGGR